MYRRAGSHQTRIKFSTAVVCLAAFALWVLPAAASASSPASGTAANFAVRYAFKPFQVAADARTPTPAGIVQGTDGRIYGVGQSGGTCTNGGAVYSIGLGDANDTLLHSFVCDDHANFVPGTGQGYGPAKGGIVDGKDGWYYGTTLNSYDSSQAGQIYRVRPDGSLFQIVHAWSRSDEHGAAEPSGRLLLASDGYLYGVTFLGGSCGEGAVYRIKVDPAEAFGTPDFKTVYSFCHGVVDDIGQNPIAGLVEGSDGALYGTTAHGGSSAGGDGTIFKLTVDSNGDGSLQTLHSFNGFGDGSDAEAPLLPAGDGTSFYGTTASGNVNNNGEVFKISSDGTFSVVHNFGNDWGKALYSGVTFGPGHFLYGVTWGGGAYNSGTIYALDPDSGTVNFLHSFNGDTDGGDPYSQLLAASDGNFYGTTQDWGPYGCGSCGVLFKASFVAVRIKTPDDGTTYEQGSTHNADYSCYGSGDSTIDTCVGDVPVGDPIDTSTLGHHTFTVTGTDQNGTQASRTVDYTVVAASDAGPPSSQADSPPLTNQTSFDVSYTASDSSPSSGLGQVELWAKGPSDVGYSKVATDSSPGASGSFHFSATEGDGDYSFYTRATDNAGHYEDAPASADTTTKVDTKGPSITITTPQDGATYDQGATIDADYSCADEPGGSGLADQPDGCKGDVANGSPVDTSSLGQHSFTVTAKDRAGNPSSKTVHYTVADNTAPSVTITTPADGATYGQNSTVNADYTCTDNEGGSGLADPPDGCKGPVANGSPIDTSTLGDHSFTVTAKDKAGNTASETVHYTVVDNTRPTITITTPADGATYAQNQVVKADYSCKDEPGGSGLAPQPDGCKGDVANGSPVDTSSLGQHSFTVTAKDNAGNTSSKTVNYTVVDSTPPTITITTPADGATYYTNQVVKADYSCKDEPGGSGLAPQPGGCKGDVANGAAIDTGSAGQHSFTVTAEDNAGNTASKTVHYTVIAAEPLQGGGMFAIGDKNADVGTKVTFWSGQWWKLNTLSGGLAPPAFEGFIDSTKSGPPSCGYQWSVRPANSPPPPDTLPKYMLVVVPSNVTKSGPTLSGDAKKLVIVKTEPGYQSNSGHPGTGTVVGTVCG